MNDKGKKPQKTRGDNKNFAKHWIKLCPDKNLNHTKECTCSYKFIRVKNCILLGAIRQTLVFTLFSSYLFLFLSFISNARTVRVLMEQQVQEYQYTGTHNRDSIGVWQEAKIFFVHLRYGRKIAMLYQCCLSIRQKVYYLGLKTSFIRLNQILWKH